MITDFIVCPLLMQGAFFGSFAGLILDLWIGIGAIVHTKPAGFLPLGMCRSNETLSGTTESYMTTEAISTMSYMTTEFITVPPVEE